VSSNDAEGDEGTFAWADNTAGSFVSSGPNQFLVRADGGLMFNTNALASSNDDVNLKARPVGGDSDIDFRLIPRDATKATLLFVSNSSGTLNINPNPAAGFNRLSVGGGAGGTATLSNGGTWTNASSRSYKEALNPVNGQEILAKVMALPISTWQYINANEGQHMGPMAEDFHAAFGLGNSDKGIGTVDADGVALAAIQGLNQKLESENSALRASLGVVMQQLRALEARIAQ
jgi:trimeric autotransporter adhesin